MLLEKLGKDAEGVPGTDEITKLRQHLLSLPDSKRAIVAPNRLEPMGNPLSLPDRK